MNAARAITAERFVVPPLVDFALNFVREETRESCTRLCALCCCATGCGCGIATIAFAFVNPSQAATAWALVGLISSLIGGGMGALLGRKRKPDPDPDAAADGVPSLPTTNSNSRLPSLVAIPGGAQ